MFSTPQTVSIY